MIKDRVGFSVLGLILLPFLLIYLLDSNGLITDPDIKEEEFIQLADSSIQKRLTEKDLAFILQISDDKAINLKVKHKDKQSLKFLNGTFRLGFFNALNEDNNYYKFIFRKTDDNNYYMLIIRSGIFEKLSLIQKYHNNERVLFSNFIPLKQNRFNRLHIILLENHIVILLNKILVFHLLVNIEPHAGRVDFGAETNKKGSSHQAIFAPENRERNGRLLSIFNKIPYISLK